MFRCYSYTIIRERINLCLLKLQLLKQSIKMLLRWWCGCIYYVLICVCMLHCSAVVYCRTVQHADYFNNCNS